jgi:hypothetical protein
MTRGTRAYLRLDPGFDEHKESYPDGPYAALITTFCLAESQPERGRFRNARFLRALMGKRGRHLAYLMAHGDLVELPDGRLYVDGWDEWQEHDWKVQERLERLRERRERNGLRRNGSGPRGTVDPVAGATPSATEDATASATALRLSGAVPGGAVPGEAPIPPPSGGSPRANGTNPRAIAAEITRRANAAEAERKARRKARHVAYLDGRLTEAQRLEMDERDAPLEEVPAVRGAAYQGASA